MNESNWGYGGERIVRNKLLDNGRKLGGSHFLILDADECLSSNYIKHAKSEILELKPGNALALPWVNLWKKFDQTCGQGTPWAPQLKDFAFADPGEVCYPERLLHFSRTPLSNPGESWIKSKKDGVVLHTQFAQWERTQIKQAWYRCLELIFTKQKARHINLTYEITKDSAVKEVFSAKKEWINGIRFPKDIGNLESNWHLQEIFIWFERFGPVFFERLDIWHIKELKDYFEANIGRSPKSPLYPSIFRKKAAILRQKIYQN